jgi:hypothetical protein
MENFKEFAEATSPAIRMQKALEKIKADRERKERLAEPHVPVKSVFKKPVKEETLEEDMHDEAQKHLSKASKALETSDMMAHHHHMADYHDALSQWHDSKGRGRTAEQHAEKSEHHAEKYTALARKAKSVKEEKKDKYDEGEYDREGDMAKSDLRSIIANAQKMHDMIDDADNLPEWVQSKITIAEDYISTVANYMTAEVNEETEQLDEISQKVKQSYLDQSRDQVSQLKKHIKGEYSGIVKRMIARRKKGIALASK